MITRIWNALSNMGVHADLPFAEKSRVRISNQMATVTSLMTFGYMWYGFFGELAVKSSQEVYAFFIFHLLMTFLFLVVIGLNRMGYYLVARFTITTYVTALLLYNSLTLALPFRSEMYFFASAAFSFIIFKRTRIVLPVFLSQVLCYMIVVTQILHNHPAVDSINAGLFMRVSIAFATLFMILYLLREETDTYQVEVEVKNLQLSSERDEMQKINFTKDKIFSIISHDLRSPIGSLKAVLSLLRNEQLTPEEFRKAAGDLDKQVQQLQTSLDELLTWSKAQLHGINPSPRPVALRPLIAEIVTIHRLAARNKKIIITTHVPADSTVFADPNILRTVVSNLVSNGIKFTPVGGAITLSAQRDNKHVHLKVEDTGVGITPENMQKILSPSIHFSTRGTNNEKGTGLGLVMCKEFVEKSNGSLSIHSEDGKGSSFEVTLPYTPDPPEVLSEEAT